MNRGLSIVIAAATATVSVTLWFVNRPHIDLELVYTGLPASQLTWDIEAPEETARGIAPTLFIVRNSGDAPAQIVHAQLAGAEVAGHRSYVCPTTPITLEPGMETPIVIANASGTGPVLANLELSLSGEANPRVLDFGDGLIGDGASEASGQGFEERVSEIVTECFADPDKDWSSHNVRGD